MSAGPSVEIRILASPTPEFALMLAVFWHSLRQYGGLGDVCVTVFTGQLPEHKGAAAAFTEWLPAGIRIHPIAPSRFLEHGIHGSAGERFDPPAVADLVICMDADMVVCGSLQDLAAGICRASAVAGIVAHVRPFSQEDWRRAYAAIGLEPPTFPYRYTGWPYMWAKDIRRPGAACAPPYFNFGFVVAPATLFDAVRAHYWKASLTADRLFPGSMFRSQIALTLAIERAGVAHRSLGLRYNFPNDINLEALHGEELRQARVIHLLRRNQFFDKQKVFRDPAALRAFATSDWETAGALERARRVIAEVLPEIEARPLPAGLAAPQWEW